MIAHRAHWIALFLGWFADGLGRKTVYFPAKGYKWNDLRRYTADLRARQADLDWPQIGGHFRSAPKYLRACLKTR